MRLEEVIEREKNKAFRIAEEAKSKGLDPLPFVEIAQAKDLAERVEGLVGPKGIAERIRELMKETKDRDKTALIIIDEILEGKFGEGDKIELGEQAIRTAITLLTEGVVVAGTEGVSRVVKEKYGNAEYLSVYFASPIRSAGGTAGGYVALLTDYVRKKLGIPAYKAREEEVQRYIEEINLYHSAISRLQYFPKEKEIRHIIENIPICIDGEATSTIEVSANRNLERVHTNCVRGGMCLVLAESIAQKAAKLLKISNKLGLGWDWLEGLVKVTKPSEKITIKPLEKYLSEVVGGRPIFAYPSRPGGFRLRYGRARNTGLNARAIHPAAMFILDEFPAIGTQLKIERPKKGCALVPCDSIEPPIVKLKNGDVVRVETTNKARELREEVEEILFLGDMLVSYGDFLNANHPLVPSPICEEWWQQIIESKGINADAWNITEEQAIRLSEEHKVPLHPKYTFFYNDLSKEELRLLVKWLEEGEEEKISTFEGKEATQFKVRNAPEKRLLEKICVPHLLRDDFVIIREGHKALTKTLGIGKEVDYDKLCEEKETALEVINAVTPFPVYDKAPLYIGARMGRPEKAKERLMSPAPHGLYPISNYGGKTRDIVKAIEKEKIVLDMPVLVCEKCGKELTSYKCECGGRAVQKYVCTKCGRIVDSEECPYCKARAIPYHKQVVNLKKEVEEKLRKLGERLPGKMKGVKGTVNKEKYFEPLEKVILRAKHDVYVFKDGTSRFDATNLPLTHFKPREIGTSIEKLKELGYEEDYTGEPLTSEEQVVELWPQDLVLPERAGEYLLRVSQFIDDLLEKFYGLPRFYNAEKKEDLIGHLVIGMAPHISAGVLGRIIGFSKANGLYAHPYFHCATRRDCDGDENSVTLMLDALINFSKKYISDKAGATEDIFLVLTTKMNPAEVDDQAHDIETTCKLPLEFYEATQKLVMPSEVRIPIVKDKLGTPDQNKGLGFFFDTTSIDEGVLVTAYKKIKSMSEKVEKQLGLAEKIRAVDEKDVARRVINFHFIRDIYGNLRSFGQQSFRCVDCNAKYRRAPISGKCLKCGGKLLLTVHRGGIEKYLKVSQEIADKYGLEDYIKQRLKLVEIDLDSIFGEKEEEKIDKNQSSLADFV